MIGILRILFATRWANPWLVMTCLLLASFSEAIGIASLLPLLSVLMGEESGAMPEIGQVIVGVLSAIGIEASLLPLLALVIGGLVVKQLLTLLAMRYVGYAMAEVATGLRTDLVKALLQARWSYFVRQPVGRIANAVSTDATRAAMAYKMAADFVANALQTLVYVVLALAMSWKLTLAAAGVAAVILLVLHFLVRMARRAGLKQTQRTSQLVTYLTDVLNNVKPLKAMDRQGVFAEALDKKIAGLRKALRRQVISVEALKGFQEILMVLALGAGIYAGVAVWGLSLSQMGITALVIYQAFKNIARSQRQYQKAVLAESPFYAVQNLIEEAQSSRQEPPGSAPPSFDDGCRLEGVDFAFDGKSVLKAVDMEIPARGITVLTGASGAGKSTITDLLLDFYQPDAGRILVDGKPLASLDRRSWRRMIGYVPQDLVLFHDSILANVTLGDPEVTEAEAMRALEMADAWGFVSVLPDGLMSQVGEKGAQLSGGQRQRIAIARALATRPKLLILDEVTSALDDDTEREICKTLQKLAGEVTILAVTHRPGFLAIADRVYKLADGTITAVAPAARVALQERA